MIRPDGTTKDGKPITGKSYIFSSMTSPDILKEIKRLDAIYPEKNLWGQTKQWIGETFSQELYHKEILELNKIQANPDKLSLVYTVGSDNIPRFELTRVGPIMPINPMKPMPAVTADMEKESQRIIFRLNEGLRSVAHTYKADGKDPRPYVLGLLIGTGFRPAPGSIAEELMRAVGTEAKGNLKIISPAMPYNEESPGVPSSGNVAPNAQGSSLSNWLADPGRGAPPLMRNAPAASRMPTRGTRRSINLSDQGPVTGMETIDVPAGADINEYLRK